MIACACAGLSKERSAAVSTSFDKHSLSQLKHKMSTRFGWLVWQGWVRPLVFIPVKNKTKNILEAVIRLKRIF